MFPSPLQSAHEHDWSLHPEVCKGADDGCMYKTFNNVAHSVFHIGLNYPNEQGSMWDTKTVTLSVWPYEVVECCAMMCHETTFHGKSHAWNVHLCWNWDTHMKHQSEKGRVVARAHPLTRVICGCMHPHVTSYHARERMWNPCQVHKLRLDSNSTAIRRVVTHSILQISYTHWGYETSACLPRALAIPWGVRKSNLPSISNL